MSMTNNWSFIDQSNIDERSNGRLNERKGNTCKCSTKWDDRVRNQ